MQQRARQQRRAYSSYAYPLVPGVVASGLSMASHVMRFGNSEAKWDGKKKATAPEVSATAKLGLFIQVIPELQCKTSYGTCVA